LRESIAPDSVDQLDRMTDDDEAAILPVLVPVTNYADRIPDRHKNGTLRPTTLPPSLEKAIRCFVLTCAIRRARGQERKHNSMLIHVSQFNRVVID